MVGVAFEEDFLEYIRDFLEDEGRCCGRVLPDVPLFEIFFSFAKIDVKTVILALCFTVKSACPGLLGRLSRISTFISSLQCLVFLLSSFFLNSILAKVTPLVGHEEDLEGTTNSPLFTNPPALEKLPRCDTVRFVIRGSKGDLGSTERLLGVVVIDFIMAMVVITS